MSNLSELNMKRKKLAEQREKLEAEAQDNMKSYLGTFMEANPKIKAIKWTQYTPSFNDGDPCYFSIHGTFVALEGDTAESTYETIEVDDVEMPARELYGIKRDDEVAALIGKEAAKELAELEDFLNAKGNRAMFEAAFGDPSEVTVTKAGISVTETEAGY